jgi:3-hydroxyisobutyrate dehydrogenase-like beta-hydroxyacid dehydrogenase
MNVGLVGVGTMGKGLGKNILEAGFRLAVLDPNPASAQPIVDRGACTCASLAEMADTCDVIITCLPSLQTIRAVYLGTDGLVDSARPGTTLVDCSTGSPDLTREIGRRLRERNVGYLDAPMFRNPQAAWDGTLHLAVGGDADVLERVRTVLASFSEKIMRVGPLGAGHVIKLLNNAVTICNAAILCETFTIARAFEVDLHMLMEIMDASMASSKQLRNVAPRLINDDHAPLFSTEVVKKDLTLYAELAASVEAMAPIGETVRDLARMACSQGFGAEHHTRIATVLARAGGRSA